MTKYNFFLLVIMSAFIACNNPVKTINIPIDPNKDAHTLSNADSFELKHLDLDINVDMDNKRISGKAVWSVDNSKYALPKLKFDTYNLLIDSVVADGKKVKFEFGDTIIYLGRALAIPVTETTKSIAVYYAAGANAKALQWLEPQQTHDKKFPFLYTQSESIYARSWLPCADGPGIRFTYNARVKVPHGLLALMSADNPEQINDSSIYHFVMDKPVPAYLMALAVGDIAFKSVDSRTGVYAEKGMIDKVRWEFENIGNMVTTAEKLYGSYRWGRYDVIVLPPGFPIGGMENPKLTFSTPTVIAGDRSLVSLIAHELAHSWSGNLVTNATWNDFWLNEGFTNYFERRITEEMMGKSYTDMLWELGYQDLIDNVKELGATSRDTWLKDSLNGRDPDDGFSDIPYEKGSHFLKLIELNVGRPKFDSFLASYFNEHAFKTMNTEQFLSYLNTHLIKGDTALLHKIQINMWVYAPGIPENCPRADSERFMKVNTQRINFLKGMPAKQLAVNDWTTHEWLQFLRKMPDTLLLKQMEDLDVAFKFTQSKNAEIADLWFLIALKNNYTTAYPAMDTFLSSVGRRKFLEPLYGEMMKTEKGSSMAKAIFLKYRNNYHPLAQESLLKIMNKK